MKIVLTDFDGLVLLEPDVHSDPRGYLLETWNQPRYAQAGIHHQMLQENLSWSKAGVLRGLHFQNPHAQAKLIMVLAGEIFDVAVDVRRGSPTFAKWFGTRLSADNRRQLFIPQGFAHGFCVLSDAALVSYKCSETYHAESELAILWKDERLGIDWPVKAPVLSAKDAAAARFDDIPPQRLPAWRAG
jgi:dTDP-4-dehydrorhamnose 3,5-epimerase